MARTARSSSTASTVFVVVLSLFLLVAIVVAALLTWEASRAARAEAERATRAVTQTLADEAYLIAALQEPDAHDLLQPRIDTMSAATGLDFITVMTADGIRVTHPDPSQIGRDYIGTIPAEPVELTEQYTGTLGPSVRTIAPVQVSGDVIGWVAAGVTTESISQTFLERLPAAVMTASVVIAAGAAGAAAARRLTRRITGDLPVENVRSAVSAYESVRTLGQALRSQMHEHGNRMHTAVALIELGRTQEAVTLLTDTSRQSQQLVDLVSARRDGDPAVGALLLGKSSQAAERGIGMEIEVDPAAPRSRLTAVDAIALLGNLIDNALDAASSGPDPRWVSVALLDEGGQALRIEVSDSGPGVPVELRERVFEYGFSTKEPGALGRGTGLALVREVVETANGTITVRCEPTTFVIVLPARRPS